MQNGGFSTCDYKTCWFEMVSTKEVSMIVAWKNICHWVIIKENIFSSMHCITSLLIMHKLASILMVDVHLYKMTMVLGKCHVTQNQFEWQFVVDLGLFLVVRIHVRLICIMPYKCTSYVKGIGYGFFCGYIQFFKIYINYEFSILFGNYHYW